MKNILGWFIILALVAVTLSAEIPLLKGKGAAGPAGGDLKTASTFIGPFGYGYGWGYPYWGGYGLGYGGWGGWGYPYWG